MSKDENLAIIEEINEELKHDQIAAYIKKHSNVITGMLVAIVMGILMYSAWQDRHQRKMEDITNALLVVVQNPNKRDDMMVEKLAENAPAELRPMLIIMKSGKQLFAGEPTNEKLQPLLDLSNRTGVDLVWRDLALLIYASYSASGSDEIVKMLSPLAEKRRPFRFSAMEMIAMSYFNDGKQKEALDYLQKILDDEESPKTMKERVKITISYVKQQIPVAESSKNVENPQKI